jgi:hypothetical protein
MAEDQGESRLYAPHRQPVRQPKFGVLPITQHLSRSCEVEVLQVFRLIYWNREVRLSTDANRVLQFSNEQFYLICTGFALQQAGNKI